MCPLPLYYQAELNLHSHPCPPSHTVPKAKVKYEILSHALWHIIERWNIKLSSLLTLVNKWNSLFFLAPRPHRSEIDTLMLPSFIYFFYSDKVVNDGGVTYCRFKCSCLRMPYCLPWIIFRSFAWNIVDSAFRSSPGFNLQLNNSQPCVLQSHD